MSRTKVVLGALCFALTVACAGGSKGPPACPGAGWCASASEAATVAEPATGTTFTCPIGIRAAVASESGAQPPAGVHAGARGTLDEKATKAKRDAGDATTCCYVWNEPCPG